MEKELLFHKNFFDRNSQIFLFNRSIDANINDTVVINGTSQVTINNFTVENNRARGILLETRNVIVEKSIFNRTSGPTILFQPSLSWHEGPFAINITLNENLFIYNNEDISKNKGIISILPDPIQLIPIIKNIIIKSSTFLIGKFNEGLLQCYNISFYQNYIKTNHSSSFIFICNSNNNNTLINYFQQFYILDQTSICFNNLSSFIDLPSFALNSSFPPPIILT